MKGRYSWLMFCWDCLRQLMKKIVLSGSGRRNLLISPPRIHVKCVKFQNSYSENINETNLSNPGWMELGGGGVR
jgi:hypothetical protein